MTHSDDLSYIWEIVKESTDRKIEVTLKNGQTLLRVELLMALVLIRYEFSATETGGYRLFVTVRDGHGSGCSENWPFFVSP